MGAVYLAEQREPLRRQVAVKLIRGGLYDRRLLKRFEAEGQAMARLTHVNVASVYEAGSTEDGRPYIAMEYVPGPRDPKYCDEHSAAPAAAPGALRRSARASATRTRRRSSTATSSPRTCW